MRAFLLVIFGAIGALGVLRGVELLLIGQQIRGAIPTLAIGLLFSALFLKQWKKKTGNQSASV